MHYKPSYGDKQREEQRRKKLEGEHKDDVEPKKQENNESAETQDEPQKKGAEWPNTRKSA